MIDSSTEVLAIAIAQGGRWRYACEMARTHEKVRYSPQGKDVEYTPVTAATSQLAFKFLEGRWKLVILFHPFSGDNDFPSWNGRFAICRMLIQQLRQMERRDRGRTFTIKCRRKSSMV